VAYKSAQLFCNLLASLIYLFAGKKVRSGMGAKQWITVYNRHAPMKQR
jgi:hypothetical protein